MIQLFVNMLILKKQKSNSLNNNNDFEEWPLNLAAFFYEN